MARWRDFERLAEKILAELQPLATVKWNDYIEGHLTETKRQVDVSIRWSAEGRDYLTIVQAKDYGTAADITVVDEFLSVIRDVKATGGILICRSGFTKNAHTYARNSGISLLNLHDAQSLNWSLQLTIPIVWVELTPNIRVEAAVQLEAGDSVPTDDPLGLPMTADGGKTRINPISTFERYWNGPTANRALGMTHHLQSDKPVKAIVQDATEAMQLRSVEGFDIAYTVEQKAWLGKFQPAQCRGLVDYLDEQAFMASYLPLSQIPATRDEAWKPIDDPMKIAVTTRGTVVTTAQVVVISDGRMEKLNISYMGDSPQVTDQADRDESDATVPDSD